MRTSTRKTLISLSLTFEKFAANLLRLLGCSATSFSTSSTIGGWRLKTGICPAMMCVEPSGTEKTLSFYEADCTVIAMTVVSDCERDEWST